MDYKKGYILKKRIIYIKKKKHDWEECMEKPIHLWKSPNGNFKDKYMSLFLNKNILKYRHFNGSMQKYFAQKLMFIFYERKHRKQAVAIKSNKNLIFFLLDVQYFYRYP